MARPTHLDLPNVHPGYTAHFTDYRAAEIGTVSMSPREPVEAGCYASFTLVFTAGRFGVDDTVSIRICTRQVSDTGRNSPTPAHPTTSPPRPRTGRS